MAEGGKGTRRIGGEGFGGSKWSGWIFERKCSTYSISVTRYEGKVIQTRSNDLRFERTVECVES